jgi:hypothetical protein
MKNRSTWVVAVLLLVLTTMAIASIMTFRSIQPESGQSTLRNVPGETWGTGFRKDGEERNLPPNARPQTPSGARDAPSQSGETGNAPTGRGGPATSDRP